MPGRVRAGPVRAFRATQAALAQVFIDEVTGTVTASGSVVESQTFTDVRTGTVTASGVDTQTLTFNDVVSGTFTASGSVAELFIPGSSPSRALLGVGA